MNVSVSTDALHSPVCLCFMLTTLFPDLLSQLSQDPLTRPVSYAIHRLLVLPPLTSPTTLHKRLPMLSVVPI